MRHFAAATALSIACSLAAPLAGCSGNASYKVNGRTLSVADQMYLTNTARFPECPGLSTNQVHLTLADFAPVCPHDKNYLGPDPTIEHEQIDIYFSLAAVPTFKLDGFNINPNTDCQIGGGPVYATFSHLAVNATAFDAPIVASGGHLSITQYDPAAHGAFGGKFTGLIFSGSTINGSFSAANCDH
jgi:hypothetical protein